MGCYFLFDLVTQQTIFFIFALLVPKVRWNIEMFLLFFRPRNVVGAFCSLTNPVRQVSPERPGADRVTQGPGEVPRVGGDDPYVVN